VLNSASSIFHFECCFLYCFRLRAVLGGTSCLIRPLLEQQFPKLIFRSCISAFYGTLITNSKAKPSKDEYSPEGLCKASIFGVACGKGAPILARKRALEGEVG